MSDDGFLSRWARRKAQVKQGMAVEPSAPPAQTPARTQSPAAAAEPLGVDPSPARAPRPVAAAIATATAIDTTPAEPATAPGAVAPDAGAVDQAEAPPPPTLDDVALLDRDAPDFSRFVARDVQPDVRNAALKKLFTDPHFNVMDRLDIYIDDYGQPDPLPEGMLARMAQGQFLSLFPPVKPDTPPQRSEAADNPADAALPAGVTTVAPGEGPHAAPDAERLASHTTPASDTAEPPCAACPPPLPDENADLRLQPHDAAGRSGSAPGPEPDTGRPD